MKRTIASMMVLFCTLGPAVGARADDQLVPPGAAPAAPPPPPPSSPPPPPHAQPIEPPTAYANAAPMNAAPTGQWVFTRQYGWLWMPYDDSYTQVVPDASLAYEYVYYPSFGWRWVVSPWVLGLGVAPYWGTLGPRHFAWYSHPHVRVAVPFRGAGWHHPMVGHAMGRVGHGRR